MTGCMNIATIINVNDASYLVMTYCGIARLARNSLSVCQTQKSLIPSPTANEVCRNSYHVQDISLDVDLRANFHIHPPAIQERNHPNPEETDQ